MKLIKHFKRFLASLFILLYLTYPSRIESKILQGCDTKNEKTTSARKFESEHRRDVEAPFIKMKVLLKETGHSKLGSVTIRT